MAFLEDTWVTLLEQFKFILSKILMKFSKFMFMKAKAKSLILLVI